MVSASQVWPIVHAERARLVDDLGSAPGDAWTTASLCPGWNVHDVLAHLVDTAKTSRVGFISRMALARFDFDRMNDVGVRREKDEDPNQTLDAMRAALHLTLTPPAPFATRLVEAFVHGEDIRRPLEIPGDYPVHAVSTALSYQAKASVAMGGGRQRVDGLRLVATDSELTIGQGPEVRGRSIDLLMAVSGRPVSPGALEGPGVAAMGLPDPSTGR
jgi:uncharacterized protein (TIGR03083 family)